MAITRSLSKPDIYVRNTRFCVNTTAPHPRLLWFRRAAATFLENLSREQIRREKYRERGKSRYLLGICITGRVLSKSVLWER